MSIIYDALKKTQEKELPTPTNKVTTKPSYNFKPAIFLLFLLAILPLVLLVFLKLPITHVNLSPSLTETKPRIPIILNGTFVSDKTQVAMINDKLYELGSAINGMTLKQINNDNIILEDQSKQQKIINVTA